MRSLRLGGLLIMLVAGPAMSQQLPTLLPLAGAHHPSAIPLTTQVAAEPGIHSPLLAAAGLGILGWGIGALVGHSIQGDCFEEFCEFEGIFYGGAAGGGFGLAIGAHLGNRKRGSFPLDILASGAVWGAGYLLLRSFTNSGDDAGVALTAIVLPPTQLLTTVLVERASGRSRAAAAARAP